jgi:hypothetical protein
MSFSYKTLNSNDITLTSYIANKQWEANSSSFSQNGVTIYVGENLPVTRDNPFNPIDDTKTSNGEYRRLVYESIKHLYYENYISKSLSGQFFNSSSYFNYEQSTLVSGTIRNLTTITGSNLNPSQPVLYDNPTSQSLFDKVSTLYDLDALDPDAGSRVVVISIDKSIYGSGLSPKSVNISGSTYNIQDDGEGNLLDTLATSSLYVGNVFYSQGLIVITNQNYLCALGIPPTAVNNYFSYNNTTPPSYLDILGNDFTDCGNLDYASFLANTIPGYTFPNYTQNNGLITITPDQTSVIPGNYQLGYTIASTTGMRSNTGSINLTITSQPLTISNISNGFTCWGTSSLVPVTCSINYGVPYYSWSFDGGASYTSSNSLTGITVSGSILSSTSSVVYVKDYTGTVYTSSLNMWRSPITYTYNIINNRCYANPTAGGTIYVYKTGTAISASIGAGGYFALPAIIDIPTTSSLINFKNVNGCVTSSTFLLPLIPALTASIVTSSISCFGGNNGFISASFTNVYTLGNDGLSVLFQSGSTYFTASNGYNLNGDFSIYDFPNYSFTVNNLKAGIYTMSLDPGEPDPPLQTCQYYGPSYITISQPSAITFSATASYINSCSNAVIFSAAGGTPPYTYFAANTGSGVTYSSDSSSVSLTNLSGGNYNLSVLDSKGCTANNIAVTVFGREFAYTGSVCSGSEGYVSSSGIQQTFNSGPYSGSLVTSSYSSGSILSGPTVNFKQLFVSGTLNNIFPCPSGTLYTRISYNPVLCPPGGCAIPVLTSATVTSCGSYDGNYNISYNSGSTSAIYTYIQYSTDNTFASNITASRITNSSPLILPINVNNLPFPPSSPYTTVYFRAYNSCSSGFGTSSFSNILSASCTDTLPTSYESFTLQIKNHAGVPIRYKALGGSVISIANNQSASYSFATQTTSFKVTLGQTPFFLEANYYGTYDYQVNVSSSTAVDCNVSTTVTPLLSGTVYSPTTINCGYTDLGTYADYDADALTTSYDVQMDIDRGTYTPGGTIIFDISPNYFF